MNQTRALPWVIDILDDGLRIYRRWLSTFLIATALGYVPLTIVSSLINLVVVDYLGEGWQILAALIVMPFSFSIAVYTIAVVSRMAAQAVAGQQPNVRAVARMPLSRLFGTGCYTALFTLIVGLCFGMIGGVCACIAIVPISGVLGASAFLQSSGSVVPFTVLIAGLSGFIYLLSFSAITVAFVYAVQPFALETSNFSTAMRRGNDFVSYRLGRNLLCFLGAGAIFTTVAFAYGGSLLVAGTLIASANNFNVSSTTLSTITSLVSGLSMVVLLPPLPIWMTLLFLRIRAERDGGDLDQRVAAWAGPDATGLV